MCWHSSGLRFVTGHRDGSVAQWRVEPQEGEEQDHLLVRKKYFGKCVCEGGVMATRVVIKPDCGWH